jgi:hypothetical protein
MRICKREVDMRKGLIESIFIFLMLIILIFSSINTHATNFFDDTTPPVTTITLDPSEPNGLNGWYVTNVNVSLHATDDLSGVKTIYYQIEGEPLQSHDGDYFNFTLEHDCLDGIIEYFSVDIEGNVEEVKSVRISIDQLPPDVELVYEVIGGNPWEGWEFLFTSTAVDACSGLDRVEFYLNDVLQDTVTGPGPIYSWSFIYFPQGSPYIVRGLITNLNITNEFVNFFALFVMISGTGDWNIKIHVIAYDKAGNCAEDEILQPSDRITPGIYIFKNLQLPNDYQGFIGDFIIWAKFL